MRKKKAALLLETACDSSAAGVSSSELKASYTSDSTAAGVSSSLKKKLKKILKKAALLETACGQLCRWTAAGRLLQIDCCWSRFTTS